MGMDLILTQGACCTPALMHHEGWSWRRCCAVLSHFSRVQLSAPPRTVDPQAPLSMGFPRQEYWSGLPCPPQGNLPHPGIKAVSLYVSCIGRWVLHHWEAPLTVNNNPDLIRPDSRIFIHTHPVCTT